MLDNNEIINLTRDCEAISVPFGEKQILKKGSEVQIMQAMVVAYTIYSTEGVFSVYVVKSDSIVK